MTTINVETTPATIVGRIGPTAEINAMFSIAALEVIENRSSLTPVTERPVLISGIPSQTIVTSLQQVAVVVTAADRVIVTGSSSMGSYIAGEAIRSSSLTHVSPDDGLIYNADRMLDRWANCFTISGCDIGESITVAHQGLLYGLSGIQSGKKYYLGIQGGVTDAIPMDGITQQIGDGASANVIAIEISEPITWE